MASFPDTLQVAVKRSHGHVFAIFDADERHMSQVSPSIGYKKRALLVDDIGVNRAIVRASLHRVSYLCDQASNGQQAVDMVKQTLYDVVLMDVQLPVLDGVESTMRIREYESAKKVAHPCIIYGLTVSCDEVSLQRYNESGMDGCIEKGCVVARALPEALSLTRTHPHHFLFISSRNVHSLRRRCNRHSSHAGCFDGTCIEPVHPGEALYSLLPLNIEKQTKFSLFPVHVLLVRGLRILYQGSVTSLEQPNIVCHTTSERQSALEILRSTPYEFILLDVDIHPRLANDVARSIREKEMLWSRPSVVIFAFTANSVCDNFIQYEAAGMNGCIEKGCLLERAVRDALRMVRSDPNIFLFFDSRNSVTRLRAGNS